MSLSGLQVNTTTGQISRLDVARSMPGWEIIPTEILKKAGYTTESSVPSNISGTNLVINPASGQVITKDELSRQKAISGGLTGDTVDLRRVWEGSPDLKKEFPTFEGKGISGDWDMVEWSKRYPSDYKSRLSKLGTTEITQAPTDQQVDVNSEQQVKDAYQSIVGRQPDSSELKHHITNKTDISHLKNWLTDNRDALTRIQPPSKPTTSTVPTTEDTTTLGVGVEDTTTGPSTKTAADYEQINDDKIWEYWQEIRENTENGGMGPKLYEIYNKREDLQAVYDASGNAIPGKGADGFTMQHWAMEFGWKEDPSLIMYKPENVVRSIYRFPFRGEDPFATGTFDTGAADYVSAIKNRQLTTIDGLLGAMRVDAGGEWDNLTDSQQSSLLIDAYIPAEGLAQIPKFSEFWDEAQARKDIEERVNTVYGKLMGDYLEGKEIDERRYIEDWARLSIGDLTDDEMKDLQEGRVTAADLATKLKSEGREPGEISEDEARALTDVQRKFTQALKQATEGYAAAGLTYSSIRQAGETGLREELGIQRTGIQTEAERLKESAERIAERGQEDIAFDIKAKTTEVEEREKPAEIETAVTQRRAEEITKYGLLKSQTEEDILKQQEEALKKASSQGF